MNTFEPRGPVEFFLTYPLAALYRTLRWVGIFAVFSFLTLFVIFYSQVGWIFGLGPRSQEQRQLAADLRFEPGVNDGAGSAVIHANMQDFDIDFRNRRDKLVYAPDDKLDAALFTAPKFPSSHDPPAPHPVPLEDGTVSLVKASAVVDHFWITDPDIDLGLDDGIRDRSEAEESIPFTQTSFMEHTILNRQIVTHLDTIRYCNPLPSLATDMRPPTQLQQDDMWFYRKAARLRVAYETGAEMVSALRSTLAHLKLHQKLYPKTFVSEAGLGSDTAMAGTSDMVDTYCNADGASAKSYTPAEIETYRAETHRIHLNHAPVVRVRYMIEDILHEGSGHKIGLVTGMCLVDQCQGGAFANADLRYYAASSRQDFYAAVPPLSPGQQAAEQALLQTATQEFWEQAARENGVTDMREVDAMHYFAVRNLLYVLTSKATPEMQARLRTLFEPYISDFHQAEKN